MTTPSPDDDGYTEAGRNDPELQIATLKAEQCLRFFMRRDEMNSEVHGVADMAAWDREGEQATDRNRVRWSPITLGAQAVVSKLWQLLYTEPPVPFL